MLSIVNRVLETIQVGFLEVIFIYDSEDSCGWKSLWPSKNMPSALRVGVAHYMSCLLNRKEVLFRENLFFKICVDHFIYYWIIFVLWSLYSFSLIAYILVVVLKLYREQKFFI